MYEVRMYGDRERLDIKPDCPQLFVDDYLIDTMSGVTPVLHQPEKVPPERAAEVRATPAVPGGVVTPQELGHYSFPALQHTDEAGRTTDPPTWTFSPQDIPGMYDPRTPTRRPIHVRFCWGAKGEGGYGLHRAVSYDGATWGPWQLVWPRLNDGPGECHSLFWDFRKECLVDMVRMGSNYPHGRTMGRGESPDFGLHWTPPVRVLTEDGDDPEDVQVYNVEAGIYAGIYLAVVHLYHTESGLCFPQLATSRDGYRFSRSFRQPFLPLGAEGGPEGGMIWCGYPVFDGERLRLAYTAYRETHNMAIVSPSVEGAAYLRKDGFVSLDAADHLGTVVTRPFRCPARDTFPLSGTLSLFVNAVVREGGELRVSILDQHGACIVAREKLPLDAAHADVITGDHLHKLVSWKGVTDVAALNVYARAIRIRFDMTDASLYSFGFHEYHGTADKPVLRVQDTTIQEE